MKLEKIDVIKNPFYKWTVPNEIIDQVSETVKTLEYSDTFQNYFSLNRNLYCEELITFIDNALNSLKEDLYPNNPHFTLKSTQIWATRNGIAQKHHRHLHLNSIFSGIIYLSTHKTCGATRFHYPNIYHHHESLLSPVTAPSSDSYTDLYPERGTMIIFPSNIQHETTPNKDNKYRYVISFNSFFTGTIGHTDAATSLGITVDEPLNVNLNLTKRRF